MQNASGRLDVFIVIVAVLVALAAILTFLVQRELPNQEGAINAISVQRMMDVAGDPMTEFGVATDYESEVAAITKWVKRLNKRMTANGSGEEIAVFFSHPYYSKISVPNDAFRSHALQQFKRGSTNLVSRHVSEGENSYMRHALPLFASRDCDDCGVRSVASFSKGDLIGFREVKIPYVSAVGAFVDKALVAGLFLIVAMLVLVMAVFPVLQQREDEREFKQRRSKDLELAAYTDPLSGLYNRRYFEKSLKEYLEAFNKAEQPLGLLLMRLDQFGEIGKRHGTKTTDAFMQKLGPELMKLTREHDVLARVGEGEFALIIPNVTTDAITRVSARFSEKAEGLSILVDGVKVGSTLSVGIGRNVDEGRTIEGLIGTAKAHLNFKSEMIGEGQAA